MKTCQRLRLDDKQETDDPGRTLEAHTPKSSFERMSDLPGLLVIMSCSGVISSIEWAQPK